MASTDTVLRTDVSAPSASTLLDPERLHLYQVALAFQRMVPQLLPRRGAAALRDQLDRASASVALNIAEGCGRWTRADKAHFYTVARGSTMECAAVLDVLLSRGLLPLAAHRHARGLLIRVTQMLTKLILRMSA
jgi:four helix bundle protein